MSIDPLIYKVCDVGVGIDLGKDKSQTMTRTI